LPQTISERNNMVERNEPSKLETEKTIFDGKVEDLRELMKGVGYDVKLLGKPVTIGGLHISLGRKMTNDGLRWYESIAESSKEVLRGYVDSVEGDGLIILKTLPVEKSRRVSEHNSDSRRYTTYDFTVIPYELVPRDETKEE